MLSKSNVTGNPEALYCEAEGLTHLTRGLAEAGVTGVRVPVVQAVSEQTLTMERVAAVAPTNAQWARLGEGLAALHQQHREFYGWHRDNLIGLAPQPNAWHRDWATFFLQYRLAFQVNRIADRAIQTEFARILDAQSKHLVEFLNAESDRPSLVHGDLWCGNVLFSRDSAWLIDPAVHCADREVDLAMTELFGGFVPAFYQAYDRIYPRTLAYPRKREIYNLYHLLNHYNLFGSGYLGACRAAFAQIADL